MLYPSKYVLVTDIDSRKKDNCISESKKCVNSDAKSYRCSEIDKENIESSVLNFCDGIQKSAAGVLPERVWQDSIMNPAYTKSEKEKIETHSENNNENSINAANGIESSSKSDSASTTWNFAEPSHKANCSCTRQVLHLLSLIFNHHNCLCSPLDPPSSYGFHFLCLKIT